MKKLLLLVLALLLATSAVAKGVEFAEQYGVRWFQEGTLFGLKDAGGAVILPAQFAVVEPFREDWAEGRALARVNGRAGGGLIDAEGNAVVEPFNGEVFLGFGGVLITREYSGAYGNRFLDAGDGHDLGLAADDVVQLSDDRLMLRNARTDGEADERMRAAAAAGTRTVVVDRAWNVVLAYDGKGFSDFKDGVARVLENDRYGILREDGTWLSEPQWEWALPFSDGYALVKKNERYQFLDANGERAFGRDWLLANDFKDGVAFVYDGALIEGGSGPEAAEEEWQIIDTSGNVIAEHLPRTYWFTGGRALFEADGLWGYLDTSGNVAVKPVWKEASEFTDDGLALVRDPKTLLYGYIDTSGVIAIPCQYVYAGYFSQGLSEVKRGDLWGYIDTEGNEVIAPMWTSVGSFDSDGFAGVYLDGVGYTIDASGAVFGAGIYQSGESW